MSRRRAAGPIALVLLGCGHAAPPAAPAPIAREVPDCDGAQTRYEQMLAGLAARMEDAARSTAQARLATMAGVTRQRCREDEWPVELTRCMAAASTEDAQHACALTMRADHHRRWVLQLMTGDAPAERRADDELGSSCVQIQANYDRLYAASNPPGPGGSPAEPTHVQGWIAQILFERCVVDNWPEPARSCFGRATGKNTCSELLPEAARTALSAHLVDMAESLGVPY